MIAQEIRERTGRPAFAPAPVPHEPPPPPPPVLVEVAEVDADEDVVRKATELAIAGFERHDAVAPVIRQSGEFPEASEDATRLIARAHQYLVVGLLNEQTDYLNTLVEELRTIGKILCAAHRLPIDDFYPPGQDDED